jgi:hypothetical protein
MRIRGQVKGNDNTLRFWCEDSNAMDARDQAELDSHLFEANRVLVVLDAIELRDGSRAVEQSIRDSLKAYADLLPTSFEFHPYGTLRSRRLGLMIYCLLVAGFLPGAHGQTITPVSLATSMGTANVCPSGAATPSPCSRKATLSFHVSAGTTIGSVNVVTQGTPNLDFVATTPDASTTLCTAQTYASATTCTVDVTFAPRFPGLRMGAVVLRDGADNVLATSYLGGTGTGPQAGFFPGNRTQVSSPSLIQTIAITADAAGNVYLSANIDQSDGNEDLFRETPSAGGYLESRIGTFWNVKAVVVDGAGNVFAALGFPVEIVEESPVGSGYSQTAVFDNGFNSPESLAVDGNGALYIADTLNERIVKETPSASGYVQSTVQLPGPGYPEVIALDANDNLYVLAGLPPELRTTVLFKETLSGGSYSQSTLFEYTSGVDAPDWFALDAAGDIYLSKYLPGSGNHRTGSIWRETLSSGGYVESEVPTGGWIDNPEQIALGGDGSFYIATGSVALPALKIDVTDPPALAFAASAGANSNLIQTVTVENSGNAPLIIPVPSAGNNPNLSANFTLTSGEAGDCPLISSGSASAGILAAGENCLLPIRFTPEEGGTTSGSLILTDSSLNANAPAWATQTITLSGQATSTLFGAIGRAVDATTFATTVGQADNLVISGYAVDSSDGAPVSRVSILIDGTPVGNATLGIARPDIAASWNNSADLNSGWTLTISASAFAP